MFLTLSVLIFLKHLYLPPVADTNFQASLAKLVEQQLSWDEQDLAKGIYYYRLQAGDEMATGKMVKVR
ncbi:MAG: hypothetical protein V2I62_03540 [Bacteroidales bacterium]|jgi:hypothetical protein|nr:hypothetical protein [Bacteroidales bacterium]